MKEWILGAVFGLAMAAACSTSEAALIATSEFGPREYLLAYGGVSRSVQVTPWLRYRVYDPDQSVSREVRFESAEFQPGETDSLLLAAGSSDSEVFELLSDGWTFRGLCIQELSTGMTVETATDTFDLAWVTGFENWILDPAYTAFVLPRYSEFDFEAYDVHSIEVDLRFQVESQPEPYTDGFYLTRLETSYSFRGVPIPEPATACLLGIGIVAVGCAGVGEGRGQVRAGTHSIFGSG